jgi:hypothetical protein
MLIALLMVSNTVRVLDLVLLTKDVGASELRDAGGSEAGRLRPAEADLAVLLAGSDVEEIGAGWSRAAW